MRFRGGEFSTGTMGNFQPELTHLFSALLLKQNNLVAMAACVWLCANVPKCLQGGHKSWHIRGAAWPRFACRNKLEWLRGLATAVPPTPCLLRNDG